MLSILLSAFNGTPYITQQIDSILNQTIQDFTIYINDDCSTDKTFEIIKEYALCNPETIKASQNDKNSGGAKYNFLNMMLNIRDDYLMLCDQDDIWLPDKIEKSLKTMYKLEAQYSREMPLLVFTDLCVVDKELNTIAPSFERMMRADFTRTSLNSLLVQNVVTGCTVLYNRALAELLIKMPEYTVMHDWWIALVASTLGKIAYLPERTMLYRQHGGNEIGAKNVGSIQYKLDRLANYKKIKTAIAETYPQAKSLLSVYSDRLSSKQTALLEDFSQIPSLGKFLRFRTVCKLHVFKHGISRNIAYLLFI